MTATGHRDFPPDKGGKGGYVPYNKSLIAKARQNRKHPTPAERKLWFEVMQNKRFHHLKFTRQKPLSDYIVDFYCAELMLAIEIDGDSHDAQPQRDETRTRRLNALGIEVVRYMNGEILNNLEGVYEDLLKRVTERRTLLRRPLARLFGVLKHDGPAVTLQDMERAITEGSCDG